MKATRLPFMRRLHSRLLGWGSICGMKPSRPSELLLKGLPPPMEVNPEKYERFRREEESRNQSSKGAPSSSSSTAASDEPFFDIVDISAGAKHFAMVTRDGQLILAGNNRYGQIGQPTEGHQQGDVQLSETMPYFYDLGDIQQLQDGDSRPSDSSSSSSSIFGAARPNSVACGCNFNIFYQKGGLLVYAFGNNHHGQLGLGHKQVVDNTHGFGMWDPEAPWVQEERALLEAEAAAMEQKRSNNISNDSNVKGSSSVTEPRIATIVCGFNHTIIQMESGRLYVCGSNTWGELGIGSTTSPMAPKRLTFFSDRNMNVVQVAAGNSFSLFLTKEGRVYGCGATNFGQLPPNIFEPTVVPLIRVEQGRDVQRNKLMRVKYIACMTDAAVYVTAKDEVLIQGSMPELGLTAKCPRYIKVKGRRDGDGASGGTDGGVITGLFAGPCAAFVRFRDGQLYGLGNNLEGQISLAGASNANTANNNNTGAAKSAVSTAVAVRYAPPTFLTELEPVPLTSNTACVADADNGSVVTKLAISGSGIVLLDHGHVYGDEKQLLSENPIEMPTSGNATTKLAAVDATASNIRQSPPKQQAAPEKPSPRGEHQVRRVKF